MYSKSPHACLITHGVFDTPTQDCMSITDVISLTVVVIALYGLSSIVRDALKCCFH
jgi:hypothetical protein